MNEHQDQEDNDSKKIEQSKRIPLIPNAVNLPANIEENAPTLDFLNFQPPSKEFVANISAPFYSYFTPRFLGLDNIDNSRPYFFVGYHTLLSITDIFYVTELLLKKDIMLRSLADSFHFKVPGWNQFWEKMGMVKASRENCSALMTAGESVLVFPGGAREAFKRKNEQYKVNWQNRSGFAHMAIEHNYPIIPLASVGLEDAMDILYDADDMMNTWLGRFLKYTGIAKYIRDGEELPPIVKGLGWTLLPRPERLYLSFGEPIDVSEFAGKADDKAAQMAVREKVERSVKKQMDTLLKYRANDVENMGWLRRWLLKK
ncbi:lysophospholipid acyltransferase family protein [Microscilla marina]|uniref:Probable membrane protein n=1 Tax=Microscilla marina ATCC 23134 TaxID=313606 RepID=A1ZH62_MICM2|nr:lysophospholipid acyltransferase family protein [Microscilla marina]EAY30331.1 probable membrane protein [Microscilla marina ATCC 23134]